MMFRVGKPLLATATLQLLFLAYGPNAGVYRRASKARFSIYGKLPLDLCGCCAAVVMLKLGSS